MNHGTTIATTALLLTLAAAPALATSVFEDWNGTDFGFWQGNTSQTYLELRADGGVDDSGYLYSFQSQSSFGVAGAVNLAEPYTGDYAARGYARVQCDLRFFVGNVNRVVFRARYQDSGHGGWYIPLTEDFSPGQWQACAVVFDASWSDEEALAAGWVQESSTPSFQETMSNVYSAEVRLVGSQDADLGLDNFLLASASASSGCVNMVFESDYLDLDSGIIAEGNGIPPTAEYDFQFVYNGDESNPIVLFQQHPREIAFLDGVPFASVGYAAIASATFTNGLIDEPLDHDDTVIIRTDQGQYFKVGLATQVDLSVDCCYEELIPQATAVEDDPAGPRTPDVARLVSVHPNPFNPRTTVAFTLDRRQSVAIAIHDVRGKRVRDLMSGELAEGDHTVAWNGCDNTGRALPSGTYLARLSAGRSVQVRKMMLVR